MLCFVDRKLHLASYGCPAISVLLLHRVIVLLTDPKAGVKVVSQFTGHITQRQRESFAYCRQSLTHSLTLPVGRGTALLYRPLHDPRYIWEAGFFRTSPVPGLFRVHYACMNGCFSSGSPMQLALPTCIPTRPGHGDAQLRVHRSVARDLRRMHAARISGNFVAACLASCTVHFDVSCQVNDRISCGLCPADLSRGALHRSASLHRSHNAMNGTGS